MDLNCLGKNSKTSKNEKGGLQSKVEFRFDLIDPAAFFDLASVLHEGAKKYSIDNWRLISTEEHLNHALMHIYAYLMGDKQDNHLGHALCRTMMADAMHLRPDYKGKAVLNDRTD